jgi:hypothetical protein
VDAPSIADVPEHDLVELVFRDRMFEGLAVPPQTRRPISHRLRVKPKQLNLPDSAFGDIDALVLQMNDASSARASEYKRVKVTTKTFTTGRPNKLQELEKAAEQANEIAKVGVSRAWLQVIVVMDAREVTRGQWQLVPKLFELRDLVRAYIPFARLHSAVGVHVMYLAQPVDRPVTEAGQFGGEVMRQSQPQAQPKALTDAIARLFNDAGIG